MTRARGSATQQRWNLRASERGAIESCPYGGSSEATHVSGRALATAARSATSRDDKVDDASVVGRVFSTGGATP